MDTSVVQVWALVLLAMVVPTTAVMGYTKSDFIRGADHIGTLVHLMEWPYKDIMDECGFIDWSGYYGIIISPPVEHVNQKNSGWRERYMPISFTDFETRSGTEDELKKMLAACHGFNRLRVFADLNLNSMLQSKDDTQTGFGGTEVQTSIYQYGNFRKEQFHESCKISTKEDMMDLKKVYECEVDDFQDLNQDNQVVIDKLTAMMNKLIDMGVYGFRLVNARHIDPASLGVIYGGLRKTLLGNSRLIIHDINDEDECVSKSADYEKYGIVTDYKYKSEVTKYFMSRQGLSKILNWGGVKVNGELKPRDKEPLVFLYNHLNQHERQGILRPDSALQKSYFMASAFMMAFPYGIPMVLSSYYGEEAPLNEAGYVRSPRPSNYWSGEYYYTCDGKFNCEHREDKTVMMSIFKANVKEKKLSWLESDEKENWFAFAREDSGFIFFNNGKTDQKRTFENLPLKPGKYCDLATGELVNYGTDCSGRIVEIKEDSSATIEIKENDPNGYVAIMSKAWINPKKVEVAQAVNSNKVTKLLFDSTTSFLSFWGNAVTEAAGKMVTAFHNPKNTMMHVAAAGVGSVAYTVFTTTADMIESVGRRMSGKDVPNSQQDES